MLHGSTFSAPYGEVDSDLSMLVIRQKGLYGFGDAAGNILIQPQFQDARPFCEDLAAVKKNGQWGYIDRTGKTVIPIRFNDASDFHNGKAFVATGYTVMGNGQFPECSVINLQGKVVRANTEVSTIIVYHDGVYLAMPSGSFVPTYVDSNGDPVLAHVQDSESLQIWGYSDGMYLCRWWKDHDCFFVDSKSGAALMGDFGDSTAFSEGMAAVYSKDQKGWGYIDHAGKYVMKPIYDYAEPFYDGLAWVADRQDKQYHVIDKTGKSVCVAPPGALNRGHFSEGMCMMQDSGPREDANGYMMYWGYMDKTGKMVIPCQFQETSGLYNGIAQVWKDGKMSYIDKAGKYIWDLQ